MKPKNLAYLILKALEDHYLCSSEIFQKLRMSCIDIENEKFYPTLSQLQLNNLLCYNWIKNKSGQPVKYYHLTRNGFQYIHHQS
jgi:DNA-binding PadR family transcriptional regulator